MDNNKFINLISDAIQEFKKQGEFSKDTKGKACYYFHPTKKISCIIGHMMPTSVREVADQLSSHTEVDYIRWSDASGRISFPWIREFTDEQIEYLRALQKEHDNGENFESTIVELTRMLDEIREEYEY